MQFSTVQLRPTFSLQFFQCSSRQRAADFQSLGDDGRRDQLVTRHLFVQFIIRQLVKQHQVVELVAHFPLGPLLLVANQNKHVIIINKWTL